MDQTWKTLLQQQTGAAIDMLENALDACPEELWSDRSQRPEFWYVVYHTLFFLDLYSSGPVEGFVPPAPFNLDELDPAGVLPERPYTKDELRTYLKHGRAKCLAAIGALTEESVHRHRRYEWLEASEAELVLTTLRHVQHHAAQLNLILRQKIDDAPRWVRQGRPVENKDPTPA